MPFSNILFGFNCQLDNMNLIAAYDFTKKNIYVGMAAYLNQKKQRASLHVDMHARRSKCPNLRSNKQIENLMFGQILLSVSLTVTTSSI